MIINRLGVDPQRDVAEPAEDISASLEKSPVLVAELGNESVETIPNSLQTRLGAPVLHKLGAGSTRLVSIRADSQESSTVRRPQNTPETQSPHTDGCFMASPPTVVALYCSSPAASGGESVLVDGARLLEECTAELAPHELSALFRDDAYEIARGDQVLRRAVLVTERAGGPPRVGLYFSSHEFNTVDVHPDARRGFDLLARLSRDPSYQQNLDLRAGECLIFVNSRILHGRRSWRDSETAVRHFQRGWYAAHRSRVSAGVSADDLTPRAREKLLAAAGGDG
ncbi:TauD/TfdA family dioxygenase [Kitasatospora sp. NPDC051853]|uniref:TauD/TfdA family dioxygenase n=1 Tax=Kitasatospora sp. NPDC051853 TaxID=3364058 RepID=UPI0037A02AFE